jgi:hypothetical protein
MSRVGGEVMLDISTIVALALLNIIDIMTHIGHLRLERFSRAGYGY